MSGTRIRNLLKKSSGFTMLEMIITLVLVSIFFTGVVTILPVLTKSYNKIISLNYARQIATSVSEAVNEQLRYADDVVLDGDKSIKYKYNGKSSESEIALKTRNGAIPGLVYNTVYNQDYKSNYYMDKDMELAAEMNDSSDGKKVIKITINIFNRDGTEPIFTKVRVVRLYGKL